MADASNVRQRRTPRKPKKAASSSGIVATDDASATGDLPQGWASAQASDGRTYYVDTKNRRTTWLDPRAPANAADKDLPYGWERACTDDGTPYFINHHTMTTHWEDPRAPTTTRAGKSNKKSTSKPSAPPVHPSLAHASVQRRYSINQSWDADESSDRTDKCVPQSYRVTRPWWAFDTVEIAVLTGSVLVIALLVQVLLHYYSDDAGRLWRKLVRAVWRDLPQVWLNHSNQS